MSGGTRSHGIVIASDSDAIQAKPPPQTLSLDRFALLAMTAWMSQLERVMLWPGERHVRAASKGRAARQAGQPIAALLDDADDKEVAE